MRSVLVLTFLTIGLAACDGGTPVPAGSVDAPASGPAWFEEVAVQRGLVFTHDSGHDGAAFLFPEIICGGVAILDVDNDRDLDVYFIQSGSARTPGTTRGANKLFLNDGAAHFTDVTSGSGADDTGYGMGVATGDYNDDGFVDLYVTNLGANTLLENRGDGTFTDVTARAGVGHDGWGTSAAFVDYDADGDLDLFITNYVFWSLENEIACKTPFGEPDYCSPDTYAAPAPDVLYRNDGDGTFTDVSLEAGMHTAFGNGLGVVCADYDSDGHMDIFVANDKMMNQLWHNEGDGTFRDIAALAGCAVDQHGQPKAGMGVDAADLDDDNDVDLLVVNLRAEADSFFRNEGSHFIDDTGAVGLGTASRRYTRFGVAWHDFNNDGWLDLFQVAGRVRAYSEIEPLSDDPYAEPNVLLRGTAPGSAGGRRFESVAPSGGTRTPLIHTSRGAAFGDLDGDGGMDVVVVNRDGPAYLLRNVTTRGNWHMFRVVNREGADAIGAVVRARFGERTIRREVRTGYSYCAANDPRVHIGLGDAPTLEEITVEWPDGVIESIGGVQAGVVTVLRRGSATGEED